MSNLIGMWFFAMASSLAVAGVAPATVAQSEPPMEQCELKWQAQDGR